MIEQLNAAGGANGKKFEVSALDNKTNPQETVVQAQKAVDKGAHFLTQGNGSSVAAALSEYTIKNNERNPSKQVLYLNYATVDPNLTNEKCNFWHFRWSAHSDIKMQVLTTFLKERPNVKKVYLINQDYSFGESVRSQAKAMLAAKWAAIRILYKQKFGAQYGILITQNARMKM